MTREEAIKILKAIRVYECYPKSASEETKEAIDMAIETLSAERTGEWRKEVNEKLGRCLRVVYVCSACGCAVGCEHFVRRSYCPNCGARMKGGDIK